MGWVTASLWFERSKFGYNGRLGGVTAALAHYYSIALYVHQWSLDQDCSMGSIPVALIGCRMVNFI